MKQILMKRSSITWTHIMKDTCLIMIQDTNPLKKLMGRTGGNLKVLIEMETLFEKSVSVRSNGSGTPGQYDGRSN